MSGPWVNESAPRWPGTPMSGAPAGPNVTVAVLSAQGPDGEEAPPCSFCCCTLLGHAAVVLFMASLAFAIIAGNVVTLAVFMQTRQFRTPQGYLKVSLALADMTVGALVVPFSVFTELSLMVTSAPPSWFPGGAPSSVGGFWRAWQPCKLIGPVFAGCTFVSISTIFLMTVERSVAIVRPLHKDALVTRRRTLILILLSWASSFLLALAPLFLSDGFTLEYNECSRMCNYAPCRRGVEEPAPDGSIMLLFPAFDFTLLGGTLFVNVLSFSIIRRCTHKRRLLSGAMASARGDAAHRPSFSDIKAAKTIGALTFAFTASFSPIAVFVLGNTVGNTWCAFSFFAFWMLTANSCCNVIIYSVWDQRFRKGVGLLFRQGRTSLQGENAKPHVFTPILCYDQ